MTMDIWCLLRPSTVVWLFSAAVATNIIYNLYFHPLSRFPGPVLCRSTRLYSAYIRSAGLSERKALEWHDRYGVVVRIAPDERAYPLS